jgi:hypothetical protein
VKGRYQEGAVTVEGFASRTSTTQLVQEFRANGTSGPFQLNINGVVNSQQVDILTRSRSQASVVVNDTPLTQFTDYEIESPAGLLLLKSPVPSVDADLNPVFVRVSYSVDAAAPSTRSPAAKPAAGHAGHHAGRVGHARHRPGQPPEPGRPERDRQASAKKPWPPVKSRAAHTDLQGNGSGQRVEIRHEDQALQARAWATRKPARRFLQPQQRAVRRPVAIRRQDRLRGGREKPHRRRSAAHHQQRHGAAQVGAELKLEHSLPGNIKVEVGVRYSSANTAAALSGPALPGSTVPAPTAAMDGGGHRTKKSAPPPRASR